MASLAKPTLKDLSNELTSVVDWHSLGVKLGVQSYELGVIEKNHPGDSVRCKHEMLGRWLHSAKLPTWKVVSDALWQMEEHAVAMKIKTEYCSSSTKTVPQMSESEQTQPQAGTETQMSLPSSLSQLSDHSSSPLPTTVTHGVTSPPHHQANSGLPLTRPSTVGYSSSPIVASGHQESSKAAVFAHENRQAIMDRFADFQTNVCSKLLKNGVDTEEFRLYVIHRFPPGECIPPPPANLMEVFKAISHHGLWDYYNYSPLVRIAKRFGAGDVDIERWVQTYKKDMKAYSIVAKLEDYIESDRDVSTLPIANQAKYDPRYFTPVEWKTEFIDHSLQYLTEVWELFSSHYLMPDSPPTALLDSVREGCYSVTWLVPSDLIPQLIKRAKSDATFFQQHRILRVTVRDECIYEEEGTLDPKQLFQACEQGDLGVVHRCLAAGIDVDITDAGGQTALEKASLNGSREIVTQLLKSGADVNHQDKFGQTPLYAASFNGNLAVVELLIAAGAELNLQREDGASPLHIASKKGHVDVCILLIERGANLNSQTKNGATALYIASQNNHVTVVEQLLQSGASVDTQEEDGFSPLHIASQKGHVDVCTLLIERGANLNSQTKNGWSPLMSASQHGHQVVKLLIKQGANLNCQNKNQDTALTIASYHGKVEVVKELLAAGAHTDLQANDGRTALALATWNGHFSVVKELVAKGANPNIRDSEGLTALILAIKQGHTEIVQELVHHGKADVNIHEESTGWTALFFAAKDGGLDLTRLLIQGGANVELKDKNGVTALDVAKTFSHDSVCQELQSHMSRQHEQQKTTTETKELVKSARKFLQAVFSRVEKSILKTHSMKREMAGNKSHSAHEGHKTISITSDK